MRKELLFSIILIFGFTINTISAQKRSDVQSILYFNPEVEPDVEEVKEPTNLAFFSAVSDNLSLHRKSKMLKTETQLSFETADQQTISDYAINNDADFVTVSKVKYFKVGLGKYVFSNQVIVSMKMYNNDGELVIENSYDTYKGSGRLLGSAENSIKIGTANVIKMMITELRSRNMTTPASE